MRLIENDVPLCVPVHNVEEAFAFLQSFLEISEPHALVYAILVLKIGHPDINILVRSIHSLEMDLNRFLDFS